MPLKIEPVYFVPKSPDTTIEEEEETETNKENAPPTESPIKTPKRKLSFTERCNRHADNNTIDVLLCTDCNPPKRTRLDSDGPSTSYTPMPSPSYGNKFFRSNFMCNTHKDFDCYICYPLSSDEETMFMDDMDDEQ